GNPRDLHPSPTRRSSDLQLSLASARLTYKTSEAARNRQCSRTRMTLASGETQLHCRPGVGRDPGEETARHCARMPGLRPTPERRSWGTHHRENRAPSNVARRKCIAVPNIL